LLENLKKEYPAVIEDINQELLPLGSIQKVLQNLLKELIPIKDLVQILESLIDYSKVTKNIDVLTEYVRHSLSDTIANMYKDSNGIIHSVALGENLEGYITESLSKQKEANHTLGLTPEMLRNLNKSIHENIENFRNLGYLPVFVTSATIRPYFFRLINSTFQDAVVLSYTELPANVEIEFLSKIEV
jgi:flagellar biosynthesis protein FlhA